VELQQRWGGQLYWYDGSHVGHLFSRRVQRVTERFLSGITQESKTRTAE
ncbi:MAG TPA: alpha/beta hydrolase, partial [Mycobacterium sp.]|nr:alpha/beta hydrolase [Mycobacterium sp.]